MMRKFLSRHKIVVFVLLLLSGMLTPIALNSYVNAATTNKLYNNAAEVPTERVAIVFGAGVYQDGRLTPMLADRVTAGVELYKQGRVQKLLMTGDNSRPDYDEVTAMKLYALEKGVPAQDITLDHAGFSTYESCYRAKQIFGIKQAILVTQNFHLPRAVYTCNQLGIKSVGLGTTDWGKYGNDTVQHYYNREFLSILKALMEIHVTRPRPTFLGDFEGIQ